MIKQENLNIENSQEKKEFPHTFYNGELGNLLELWSAEFYKGEGKKQNEGVAFAEDCSDRLGKRKDQEEDRPNTLVSVFKTPGEKKIDPDSSVATNYQKMLKENILREVMEDEPFLHLAVSESRTPEANDVGDIIITGGLRDEKLPCYPQVARWLKEKLSEVTKKYGVTVGVANEGDRLCGARVHVHRREEVGENYQFLKIKVPSDMLRQYGEEFHHALNDVFDKFNEEFSNKEKLKTFLRENETQEDRYRLEGKIYTELKNDPEVSQGDVLLNKNLRKALGIELGDKITIEGQEFVIKKPSKEKSLIRKPIIGAGNQFPGRVVVEKG